jgi:hypothetical protein
VRGGGGALGQRLVGVSVRTRVAVAVAVRGCEKAKCRSRVE